MLKFIMLIAMSLSGLSCQDHEASLQSEFSSLQPSVERVYIRLPRQLVSPNFVRYTRFIRDSKFDRYYAFGYLPSNFLENLPSHYKRQVEVIDALKALGNFDTRTLELKEDMRYASRGLYSMAEGYHDYEELTAELRQLASQYPNLMQLTSAGKSVQGRELWLAKISDNAAKEEYEPKLLYIANMHGDEVVGRELMIYTIRALLQNYGKSTRVTNLVRNSQIYIMPSMNPDGFERGSRFNAKGSDLNRNFPDFTSDPTDSPNGRQPETRAVMELHKKHHFVLALNYHGGAVCFNLPWDTRPNSAAETRFGDDPLLRVLGRAYTKANPEMYNGDFDNGLTYGYEWYEVNGGMQDWANYYRRSIHATIELSNAKWPNASKLPKFWELNEKAIFNYLEAGLNGFHLKVVDPNGAAVRTRVAIANQSGRRTVIYDNGIIHRPALPVKQKVRIQAEGYAPVEVELSPWRFTGTYKDVVVTPSRKRRF